MERPDEYVRRSDEELVALLGEGDAHALGELAGRHAAPVYSLAYRILGDPGWAEEVWQDVLLRLWRRPHVFDPARGTLRGWLLTVTHHAAVDGLRSRRGVARTLDGGPEPLELLPYGGDGPAETVWRQLRAEEVRAALATLPPPQREALELVYYGGLKQAEVAAHTGQPLGTVKTRVRLGLSKLRDALAGQAAKD